MGLKRSLAIVQVVALIGCGNGNKKGDTVNTNGTGVAVDAGVVTDAKSEAPPATTFAPALPNGVKPFAPDEFVSFVGVAHGSSKADVSELASGQHPALGRRLKMDKMMGSDGVEYLGGFALSWQSDNDKIDYISVKSATAIAYLTKLGRSDAKLDTLWEISPEGALGVLGKASEIIERPHSFTFRFAFDNRGRKGTLSLEFSRLGETITCSAVSVHWVY